MQTAVFTTTPSARLGTDPSHWDVTRKIAEGNPQGWISFAGEKIHQ
jgi:hypothetical protein